jgi:hypothetical protein
MKYRPSLLEKDKRMRFVDKRFADDMEDKMFADGMLHRSFSFGQGD